MAKAKKSKAKKPRVQIEQNVQLPSIGNNWPFDNLLPADDDGKANAFYVDPSQHQAVRTAATRAGKRLGRTFSVRKIKNPDHKHYGMIGVYRIN